MFHGHHSRSEGELEGREEDARGNHDFEAHSRFLQQVDINARVQRLPSQRHVLCCPAQHHVLDDLYWLC